MSSAVALPANAFAHLQTFRLEQSASLGLLVGLPQLVLGPSVALLLYQRRVDARYLLAGGLLCIALACWLGSGITSEWMVQQFLWAEILQAIGQPMAVISLLFLGTSVVQPMEGAYVVGIINTLRAFGTVFGGAVVGRLMTVRGNFHTEMLFDEAGRRLPGLAASEQGLDTLAATIAQQASVLATADIYQVFGVVALVLIPFVLRLRYILAPVLPPLNVPITPSVVAH
jgi:DHA2 family multidrug resistance protein